ncbi:MAG: DUF2867 domain-containing protein [Pseudodesulfovibrio sp.]
MGYLETIPELVPLYEGADYVEEKTIEGNVDLRAFIVGMMRKPGWLRMLYALRKVLVRPFGIRQESSLGDELRPEDISYTPNDKCRAFTVTCGREGEYLALHIDDPHLKGQLITAAVPLPDGRTRFHVGTVVHFNNRFGPVYFALILPFHHLVAARMMRAGVSSRNA